MDETVADGDQLEYIIQGLGGIMLASALFSSLAFSIPSVWVDGCPSSGRAVSTFAMGNLICVSVGSVISLGAGFLSVVVVWLFNRSLGNPLDHQAATLSAGSLAVYMPAMFLHYALELGGLFLIPIVAMVMGAFGASWSARGYVSCFARPQVKEATYKLSILRLMIATMWIALFLAAANLFESKQFVIAVATWFVCNGLLVFLAKLYRLFRPLRSRS